jgi:hypothetical protein
MPFVADTMGLSGQPCEGRVDASIDHGDAMVSLKPSIRYLYTAKCVIQSWPDLNDRARRTSVQASQIQGWYVKENWLSLHAAPAQVSGPSSAISNMVHDTGDSLQLTDNANLRFQTAVRDESHNDTRHSIPLALHLQIRGVMVAAAGFEKLRFLPLDELDSIMSMPAILQELMRSGLTSDLHSISRKIWQCEFLSNGDFTTRRKLFAILCLMERAEDIEEFIEANLFDADLPFQFGKSQNFRRSGEPIEIFESWRLYDVDAFETYQGWVMAPYFKLGNAFLEYELPSCVVLPFVDDALKPSALGNTVLDHHIQRMGGYSVVRRVRIHSAHHEHLLSSVRNPTLL